MQKFPSPQGKNKNVLAWTHTPSNKQSQYNEYQYDTPKTKKKKEISKN